MYSANILVLEVILFEDLFYDHHKMDIHSLIYQSKNIFYESEVSCGVA